MANPPRRGERRHLTHHQPSGASGAGSVIPKIMSTGSRGTMIRIGTPIRMSIGMSMSPGSRGTMIHICTPIRMSIGMSIWTHLPFSRSIPIFPAIPADTVCLSPTHPLSDSMYMRDIYCRCIIYASFIILVHCILEMFLRSNSATPILACPALVSADCQRAMQACAAMNFFGKFPGKRMGMLDSGCNELIIKLDDESRAFACD